ncbi:MAG TPA: hypothetical protein PLJ27_02670 [Polyangiaceae bacterium]|nr:hypothetical protein [Polyangiaceae bacterium]HNZ24719.1 hypothetical protein [Polyangiaceae bacterium]HOD24622.1 hypothetical protein [Polyangiaceae bacterium]HOE50723.1 hypothetical protein [Polyangiaceae bacterium]HOH03449.1 hypothetical protein [Polyangiaceae bacterium]
MMKPISNPLRWLVGMGGCVLALGCKTPREAEPPIAEAAHDLAPSSATESSTVDTSPPAAVSSAQQPAMAPSTEPSATPEPTPEPLPAVDVKNIGMHIGGGPNDRESKQPIGDSVKPHFDALRACWKHVAEPDKPGDFGVDLLIPRQGGKAEVSHPRTAIQGEGFSDCVVGVFASIDYLKPKTGKTMVSYSVRFTPRSSDR